MANKFTVRLSDHCSSALKAEAERQGLTPTALATDLLARAATAETTASTRARFDTVGAWLLERAGWYPSKELMQVVLGLVPNKDLNISERGSCPALESLIKRGSYSGHFGNQSGKEDEEAAACIEALLDAGAKWNPKPDEIRYIRRSLFEHEPLYAVRVVRLLLYTKGACDPKTVLELCRTPKARQRLHAGDPELWQELTTLAKGDSATVAME